MPYCLAGTKATVNYKFKDGSYKTYVTDKTPIDVDDTERYTPPFASGQCPVDHWVDFNVTYRYEIPPYGLVTHYFDGVSNTFPAQGKIIDIYPLVKIGEVAGGKNSVRGLVILFLDYNNQKVTIKNLTQTSRIPPTDTYAFNTGWTLASYQITSVRPVDGVSNNCGNPQPVCTIKVLHKGQVIFTDKGDCPITYSVLCGDECPPGTIKCNKSGYPGYCCLECAPIAAEIKAIASQVKRLNNG